MEKYQWQSNSRVVPIYQQFRNFLATRDNAVAAGDYDTANAAEQKIFNLYSILDPSGDLRDEILFEMSKQSETVNKWVYRKRKKVKDSDEDYFS